MGVYKINCPSCNKLFMWFSGNLDQRCPGCIGKTTDLSKQKGLDKTKLLLIELKQSHFLMGQLIKELEDEIQN